MMRTIFIVASAIACAFVPMQIAANSSVEYASELSMAEKAENGAYPEHSIADVKSNLQAWDGKMVIVSGWIASDCNKLTCHLVDKIAAVHADDEAVHELSIAGTSLIANYSAIKVRKSKCWFVFPAIAPSQMSYARIAQMKLHL